MPVFTADMRTRGRLLAGFALAAVLTAGCADDSPQGERLAAPSSQPASSGSSSAKPACLLTPAEVNEATGFTMDQVLQVEEYSHFLCHYSNRADAFAGGVYLSVYYDGPALSARRRASAEVVPGLGDEAVHDAGLTVLIGDRAMDVYLIRDEDAKYPQQEIALARVALIRYRDLLRDPGLGPQR